jgi:hypothetical protein
LKLADRVAYCLRLILAQSVSPGLAGGTATAFSVLQRRPEYRPDYVGPGQPIFGGFLVHYLHRVTSILGSLLRHWPFPGSLDYQVTYFGDFLHLNRLGLVHHFPLSICDYITTRWSLFIILAFGAGIAFQGVYLANLDIN